MTQFTPRHVPVKPTRRSPKAAEPFGSGILPFTPHYGGQPFTAADLDWAAGNLNADDDGIDWDQMAYEAELEDRYLALVATAERCYSCGLEGETRDGLCGGCEAELAWAGVV